MYDDLTGKRVLITAAATGIGRVTADAFLNAGAEVHVCDVDADGLAAFKASAPRLTTTVADVADPSQVDRLFDVVLSRFGGLDVLVNNAGISGPTATVEDCPPEDWRRTLAVNLDASYFCCRRAVPAMKRARAGVIINLSSVSGLFGNARRTPYAAAKWAIIGFTKSLALEVGPFGIRANAICPGSVEGARIDRVIAAEAKATGRAPDAIRNEYAALTALKTMISPTDVANLILFLCSNAGCKISGAALPVDGYTFTLGD